MLMDLNLNIIALASDARSYYDAYEILQEKTSEMRRIQSNKNTGTSKKFKGMPMPHTERDINLTTPALVCLAFSIELHVKLLLQTYDIIARGHDIGNLLKELPEDDVVFISTHKDFDHTHQGEYFFENIAIASKLFIRTRYYFENLGTLHFNTGFCATLAKVIRKRIVQRVPYLSYDLGSFSD